MHLDSLNNQDRIKTLLKLHRKFAHPPKNRLIALLKDADVWKEEYEEIIEQVNKNVNSVRFMLKLHQDQ